MDPAISGLSPLTFLWLGLISACLLTYRSWKRPRYPPGPRGLPVVGNVFDVPEDYSWLKYRDYGQQYGTHSRPANTSIADLLLLS